MVDSLFHELSTCQRENLELKARVRYLESMQAAGSGILPPPSHKTLLQSQSAQASPHLGIRVLKPETHQSPSIKSEVNVASGSGANLLLQSPQMSTSSASLTISESQSQLIFSLNLHLNVQDSEGSFNNYVDKRRWVGRLKVANFINLKSRIFYLINGKNV